MRDGDVVRPVAKEINIDKSTLFQYVKKTAVGRSDILVTGATAEFFRGRITYVNISWHRVVRILD